MCEHHTGGLSRRNFGILAFGAAAGAVLPARAAEVDALTLTCIDYRLVDDAVRFFDSQNLTNDYDQVSLAGASLAAMSPSFPSANRAFWDQLNIARQLHRIRKVIVLDHRDCGAYKVAFGDKYAAAPDAETEQHKHVMLQMRKRLRHKHPELSSEFHLMALDGSTERIL